MYSTKNYVVKKKIKGEGCYREREEKIWKVKSMMFKRLPGESGRHANLTSSRCSEGHNSDLELQITNQNEQFALVDSKFTILT